MKRLLNAAWLRIVSALAKLIHDARLSEKGLTLDTTCRIAPPVTHEMAMRGTGWTRRDGVWCEYCTTCGGNCGQCGMTERLGNPGFDLDHIVKATGMNQPVAGLPRG